MIPTPTRGVASSAPPPPVLQPLQRQHYLPDQPQFISYPPSLYPQSSSHDSVRTLFIAWLPEDVKSREIYNLFRQFPAYYSSHLRTTAGTQENLKLRSMYLSFQPFAFAVFMDQLSVIMAIHALSDSCDASL